MLSSVLRSERAAEVDIAIKRTFVQLRRLMDSNRDLARRIEAMEKRYDEQFASVFDAIKRLISTPCVGRGFTAPLLTRPPGPQVTPSPRSAGTPSPPAPDARLRAAAAARA